MQLENNEINQTNLSQFRQFELVTSPPKTRPDRRRPRRWLIVLAAVLAAAILFLSLAAWLLWQANDLLQHVKGAESGVNDVMLSVASGSWSAASQETAEVSSHLKQAKDNLRRLGPLIWLPPLKSEAASVDKLFLAATELAESYQQIFNFMAALSRDFQEQELTFNFSSAASRRVFFQSVQENRDLLAAAKEQTDLAQAALAEVKANDLEWLFKEQLSSINFLLNEAVDNTEIALPMMINLPELLGYQGEKNYLFVFQNNMELRPTGGFIGSYGVLTVRDGEIVKFYTDDIYNLDKFSEGKLEVAVPEPLAKYNGQKNLYLRDANWQPSWPDSAQTVAWFFEQERKNAGLEQLSLDGVVAINPEFVASLLKIVGPITLSGVEFKSENFAQDLERFVEIDYQKQQIAKSQRKAIIGELTDRLLEDLYNLSAADLLRVWLAFKGDVEQKNFLVYLSEENLQEQFARDHWAGEIKQTDGDYLMVVDSNMFSLKTDQAVERSLTYELSVDDAGDLVARLTIDYQHTRPAEQYFIAAYRNYARIYLPEGSWILSAYLNSPDKQQELKILSDVSIFSENGKTAAAVFFTVPPEQSRQLVLTYRLPASLRERYEQGLYQLLVQKQPGTDGHNLSINLNFRQPIVAYHVAEVPQVFDGQSLGWQTDLSVDRFFDLKF